MQTTPQSRQDARVAPSVLEAPALGRDPAIPLAPKSVTVPAQATEEEIAAICKEAADRCSFVLAGFAYLVPDRLWSETRGSPKEAFARQLGMAGLVRALGFTPKQVGLAIGRHPDTVEHACSVVDAIRGGGDDAETVLRVLGEPGVREFLGGRDLVVATDAQGRLEIVSGGEAVEEMLEHAERLIVDLFAAFELVAVRGSAFCRELKRRSQGPRP